MRFLDAVVCLGLAAVIHNSDTKFVEVAKRLSKMVARRHRPQIYQFMAAPQPCLSFKIFLRTLPDHIFTMDPSERPSPTVYRQPKRSSAVAGVAS